MKVISITDFSRLYAYMDDQFPDITTPREEVVDWAKDNVRSWEKLPSDTKDTILDGWREFVIDEEVEKEFPDQKPSIIERIKGFIRELLFRRGRK